LLVKTVSYQEVAIKQNNISKDITAGVVYPAGKYYLGLTNSFLEYPTKWQWMSFKDGGDSSMIDA
jgi:hypothetical protein